jgi:hypothetical protein
MAKLGQVCAVPAKLIVWLQKALASCIDATIDSTAARMREPSDAEGGKFRHTLQNKTTSRLPFAVATHQGVGCIGNGVPA